ncbi:MAG: thiamine pyrophosphate-dependent dehydrogenase E1 component subunit alpha [Alphaproteobacteria bacterium]|nr:thiamine pyrophosphate-dependent dehydrogenase E1 component subunit alpha [Alphaproteobacteria bacterium]
MIAGVARYKEMFRQALRIRLVEEKIIELYPSDKIQSPVHLSIGQEAVAVGVCEHLRREDLVFITYRGHAFYLAKGGSMPQMMAELYGRRNGMSQGKAGSMHLAAPDVGVMGASAVVGSTISVAVGAALAARLKKKDQISVVCYGDGATEQGTYHEALNFASLYQLPCLFLCENNGLAVHATLAERQSYKIAEHARVYGLETIRIEDGWDFTKVGDVCGEVLKAIRGDGRPRVIEVLTCRYKEHVGPGEDYAAGYRSHAEVQAWMAKDPLCTDTALVQALRPALDAEIDEAVAFAEAGAMPGIDDLLTDVL